MRLSMVAKTLPLLLLCAACTADDGRPDASASPSGEGSAASMPTAAPTTVLVRTDADAQACVQHVVGQLRRAVEDPQALEAVRDETRNRFGERSQYYLALNSALTDPQVRQAPTAQEAVRVAEQATDSICSVETVD